MKKGMKLFIVTSTLIVFASSSLAQPTRFMRSDGEFWGRSPARVLWLLKAKKDELKITDSQIEKIQNLVFSLEEKMIQMRSQISLERLNLRKLMQKEENLDYEKIKAVLSTMSSSKDEMFIERLKLREEIQNILTPEQREAVNEAIKERLQKRGFFRDGKRIRQSLPMKSRFRK